LGGIDQQREERCSIREVVCAKGLGKRGSRKIRLYNKAEGGARKKLWGQRVPRVTENRIQDVQTKGLQEHERVEVVLARKRQKTEIPQGNDGN